MANSQERLRARKHYKRFLKDIVEGRPSGTKQRIAREIGATRSFVSQICNPDSIVPLPQHHIEPILQVCEFSEDEVREFMERYKAAHPGRKSGVVATNEESLTIALPKFRSKEQRLAVEDAIIQAAETIVNLALAARSRQQGKPRN